MQYRMENMIRNTLRLLFSLTLPLDQSKDDYRKSFILNILLISSFLLSLLASLSATMSFIQNGNIYGGNSPLIPFFISLLFLLLLIISKKGHTQIASILLIVVYLIPTLLGIYQWTIYSIVSLLTLGFLIVLSGIVIGSRFMVFITMIICFFIIGITIYHQQVSPESIDWVRNVAIDPTEAVIVAILFSIISLVSYLSFREIDNLLIRTHASEHELRKERDLLELRVKQRTEALRISEAEKLSQLYRFAEIGKLTGGLFHDLVNPLTLVSYNLQELNERSNGKLHTKELKEVQQLINNAITGTKRLEAYITTVRKQLQNQSTITQCILSEEITHIVDMFKHTLRKERIHLTLSLQKNITLNVSSSRFSQVISNVFSNAIDAVITSKRKYKKIQVTLSTEGQEIIICIADNGSGISPLDLPFIYTPLFSTKKGNGTGIGLSIAKEIIESDFKGTITVVSSTKGTEFIIRFPIHSHKYFTNTL